MVNTAELTLTDFLLARIAEDEAVARDALETFTSGVSTPPTWSSRRQWERFRPAIAEQIRRHDPARVLAECAAKRRIIAAVERQRAATPTANVADEVLMLLAMPYAGHRDYRGDWRIF